MPCLDSAKNSVQLLALKAVSSNKGLSPWWGWARHAFGDQGRGWKTSNCLDLARVNRRGRPLADLFQQQKHTNCDFSIRGIRFTNKKKCITDACNMHELHRCYCWRKESYTLKSTQIVRVYVYEVLEQARRIYGEKNQKRVPWEQGSLTRIFLEWQKKVLLLGLVMYLENSVVHVWFVHFIAHRF